MHRNDIVHGSDLRSYCKTQGLTQQQLADAIGISHSTMQIWLRYDNIARRKPWIRTLLLGAEQRIRNRKGTSLSDKRHRQYNRFQATLPRRSAFSQLPESIKDIIPDQV